MASLVTGRGSVSLHDMVPMEESVDRSASWALAQARVVSMRMTWHARRSQPAQLGSPRRSALLQVCPGPLGPMGCSVLSPSFCQVFVVSHLVPVAVQLVVPSRGKQLPRLREMFLPRQ